MRAPNLREHGIWRHHFQITEGGPLRIVPYANSIWVHIIEPVFLVHWQYHPEICHYCPKRPIILVGAQIDLREDKDTIRKLQAHEQSPITHKQGEEMSDKIGAVKYVECSSLTGEGVNDVFEEAARAALLHRQQSKKKKKFFFF